MKHLINKRNGTLEIWRFLFSLYILLFHIQLYVLQDKLEYKRLDLAVCPHGAIGVEFFFILSGLFLAQSVRKELAQNALTQTPLPDDLGSSTLRHVAKKYRSIFSYHLVAFVMLFCIHVWIDKLRHLKIFRLFLESVPSLLLLQSSGMPYKNINGTEWFLSAMLISSAVIYPLCRKYFSFFSKIAAPVTGLMIIGYLGHKYGRLTVANAWDGIFYKSMLRGLAEMLLGVFVYAICSEYLIPLRGRLRPLTKLALTLVEYGGLTDMSPSL